MIINIDDIIIPEEFQKGVPETNKLRKCRDNYNAGIIDRAILINKDNVLVDGYILYLILKEHNQTKIRVTKGDIYICGTHPNNEKKYFWRVQNMDYKSAARKKNKYAIVDTKNGINVVRVKDVFFSEIPPVSTPIRKVVRFCGC